MARPSTYMYKPWSWLPDDFLDIVWKGVDFLGGVNATAYDEATQIYTAGGRLRTPEEATNLDAWMTKMNWSGLRVLHLDSAEQRTLETLGPVLKNLTQLKLGSRSANATTVFPTFLRNLTTPLTRLELSNYDFQDNYTSLIDALGETSGPHLTHLSITEHQWHQHRYCMYDKHLCTERQTEYYLDRPYLNATHLVQLATTTPNITHLDLDIPRKASNATTDSSTWSLDYDTIQAAASLPELQNLTLRLVSPEHFGPHLTGMNPKYRTFGPSDTHFRETSLNRTSVPALFANLNQHRAHSGQLPLSQLEIKTGLWDQRDLGDWGMMGAPDELVGRWVWRSEGRSERWTMLWREQWY